jgi:hypothetical protein
MSGDVHMRLPLIFVPSCDAFMFLHTKTVLAPNSNSRKLFPAGDTMTIIRQGIKTQDMKREVREIRKTARKIAASRQSARRFLISTGIYSASGQLSRQYR